MTIRRKNPRHQGDIGLGAAIGWFSANGYRVSVPIFESQAYDLIVDDGERLLRVQVKTTTSRGAYGAWVVRLSTQGGNRSWHTVKYFDHSKVELLFVLADDGDMFLLPTSAFTARRAMHLGKDRQRYRVGPTLPRQLVLDVISA